LWGCNPRQRLRDGWNESVLEGRGIACNATADTGGRNCIIQNKENGKPASEDHKGKSVGMGNAEDKLPACESPSRRRHLQDILARLRALRVILPVYQVQNVNDLYQQVLTLGDRVAIGVAAAMGSWKFILGQSVVLAGWVTLNVIGWRKSWDPYPFILMNLLLSVQAVYTGPLIMMAQNRQAEKDRLMLQEDYETNRRAAEEIRQILNILEQHGQLLEILLAQREQEKPPADMNPHQPTPSHEA